MRYQERKYKEHNLKNRGLININLSSDICIFKEPTFNVTGAEKIYTGVTSGSSLVHLISTATTVDLEFTFTGNVESFTTNLADFKYEIYQYNESSSGFSTNRIYYSPLKNYSSFSGEVATFTDSISLSGLNIDGEYLIKGYYEFINCADTLNRLGVSVDTSKYKFGTKYGIYRPETDYYFAVIKKAQIPTFTDTTVKSSASKLAQYVLLPEVGTTTIAVPSNSTGDFILTLNGLALSEDLDYTLENDIVTLNGETSIDDIISIIYTTSSEDPLTTDIIDITTITSGATDAEGDVSYYYNTTTEKYELFTSLTPRGGNDIIVMINGVTLSNNVDYYQSITNPNRIILEGNLLNGDIIVIAYFSNPSITNGVSTNSPDISWMISDAPSKVNGVFTLEVSSGTSFTVLSSSATTNYVVGQSDYNTSITISGSLGTKLYYRIKNTKSYKLLTGDIIESIAYSETVPITITINSINSY